MRPSRALTTLQPQRPGQGPFLRIDLAPPSLPASPPPVLRLTRVSLFLSRSGKKFIFDKAKELGVRVIVVDGPDSWAKSLVTEGIAERFIAVDSASGAGY